MFKWILPVLTVLLSLDAQADVCVISSAFQSMHSSTFKSQYLVRAHELAVSAAGKVGKDLNVVYYTADGSDVDLLATLEKAIGAGCRVIIGLYTSRECLLSGPFLAKNGVFAISPSCGHDDIEKYKDNLVTGVPPLAKYAKAMADYAAAQKKRVIVVHQPTDVYSKQLKESIAKHLGTGAEYIAIDKNLDTAFLQKTLKKDGKTFLLFATYPAPSHKILEDLEKSGLVTKELELMGATAWIFDLSLIRKHKATFEKSGGVFVPDTWKIANVRDGEFFKKYKEAFAVAPENLAFFSYDVTGLALECRTKTPKDFDKAKFRACLTSSKFKGTTGTYQFSPDSAFPLREVFIENLMERL